MEETNNRRYPTKTSKRFYSSYTTTPGYVHFPTFIQPSEANSNDLNSIISTSLVNQAIQTLFPSPLFSASPCFICLVTPLTNTTFPSTGRDVIFEIVLDDGTTVDIGKWPDGLTQPQSGSGVARTIRSAKSGKPLTLKTLRQNVSSPNLHSPSGSTLVPPSPDGLSPPMMMDVEFADEQPTQMIPSPFPTSSKRWSRRSSPDRIYMNTSLNSLLRRAGMPIARQKDDSSRLPWSSIPQFLAEHKLYITNFPENNLPWVYSPPPGDGSTVLPGMPLNWKDRVDWKSSPSQRSYKTLAQALRDGEIKILPRPPGRDVIFEVRSPDGSLYDTTLGFSDEWKRKHMYRDNMVARFAEDIDVDEEMNLGEEYEEAGYYSTSQSLPHSPTATNVSSNTADSFMGPPGVGSPDRASPPSSTRGRARVRAMSHHHSSRNFAPRIYSSAFSAPGGQGPFQRGQFEESLTRFQAPSSSSQLPHAAHHPSSETLHNFSEGGYSFAEAHQQRLSSSSGSSQRRPSSSPSVSDLGRDTSMLTHLAPIDARWLEGGSSEGRGRPSSMEGAGFSLPSLETALGSAHSRDYIPEERLPRTMRQGSTPGGSFPSRGGGSLFVPGTSDDSRILKRHSDSFVGHYRRSSAGQSVILNSPPDSRSPLPVISNIQGSFLGTSMASSPDTSSPDQTAELGRRLSSDISNQSPSFGPRSGPSSRSQSRLHTPSTSGHTPPTAGGGASSTHNTPRRRPHAAAQTSNQAIATPTHVPHYFTVSPFWNAVDRTWRLALNDELRVRLPPVAEPDVVWDANRGRWMLVSGKTGPTTTFWSVSQSAWILDFSLGM